MPAERILPDVSTLQRMIHSGMTQQDIADAVFRDTGVRVTRAAVSAALARAGLATYRKRHHELIPWRVRVEHNKEYPLRMLRLEARRRKGEALPPEEERKLNSWLQLMDDNKAVVHYDPRGGFYYTNPRKGVDTDLIRVPDDMVEQGKALVCH